MEALIPDKLDDVDLLILTSIQKSMSVREIAKIAFKANASIQARIDRLERLGLIYKVDKKHRGRSLSEGGMKHLVKNLGSEVKKDGYGTGGKTPVSNSGSSVPKSAAEISSGEQSTDLVAAKEDKHTSVGALEGQDPQKEVSPVLDGPEVRLDEKAVETATNGID